MALIVLLLIGQACSTEKNTALTRTYHNLTAHYNVYFNGLEAFKSGVKKVDEAHKENYSIFLPIFKYSNPEAARSAFGDMNKAIEKGSKCIRKHSITVPPGTKKGKKKSKPKKKKKKNSRLPDDLPNYVKWIDDSYLLIGKSNFYKRDFYPAIETFNYLVKEYSAFPIKYEAYIWLARTYIEMEKYEKAQEFLSILENDKDNVPPELVGAWKITIADIMLKQEKFIETIPALEEGIINTKDKKEKVRYYYILAQLYQHLDDNTKAYEAYGNVIDMNPDYEMSFNARINRASIFNSAASDSKALVRELNKMLRDDKNIDYRDQIYFALGKIAYTEGYVPESIDLYKESASASTENTNQKAVSFLAIADIYFEEPVYKEAQSYYDSAVVFLSKEYQGYAQIKRKNENLNELVENLTIVQHQDSLQRIAGMSDAERNQIIDGIIAEVIKQEEREKELLALQQSDLAYLEQSNREMSNEGGKWYFYNPAMIGMGQSEFKKKWGSRKLEDNWRRMNKQSMDWETLGNEDGIETIDSSAVAYTNKEREYYLVELPLTDSAIQVSKEQEEEAYFNIATIYKDKFYDYPLSIEGYNDLLENYPETEFQLATYYNLYKIYVLSKDPVNAELYKSKIINEYPDSDYAQILQNPDYFKELEAIEKQVNFVYQATYKYFLVGKCDDVRRNFEFVDSAYSQSKLIPKFDLLNTLCSGTTGDTVLFKENLTAFKDRHPGTEEAKYVLDVLDALDRSPREVELLAEEETVADEFAEGVDLDSIDYSMYAFNADVEHAFLIVVANEVVDPNRIKFNVSNFNIDYYDFLTFEVSELLISAKYTGIVVNRFKNKGMASNYYESVYIAGEVFEGQEKDGYRTYIISSENLKKFTDDKNIPRYHMFFENSYVGLTQD